MDFQQNIFLNDFSWFGTGGPAKLFCEPKNDDEFCKAIKFANTQNLDIFVLGEGANVLISDDGFDGLVIKPCNSKIEILKSSEKYAVIRAGAGTSFSKTIDFAIENKLTGLEQFSGIPGTVGGAVFINIHYFDFLLSQFVEKARIINRKTLEIIKVNAQWFEFGYDRSKLQEKTFYLLDADFKVLKNNSVEVEKAIKKRKEMILYRETRYPTEKTCGSFFQNFSVEEVPLQKNGKKIIHVAFYLDKLKGKLSVGEAIVSTKHANMIENKRKATSADIVKLARKMQEYVNVNFGIIPKPECQLVGFKNNPLLM